MESMMMMIFDILSEIVAWFIPYLIAKSLAFVLVTFIMWWSVLITGLLWMWIWGMEVAVLFLTLVSLMTRACDGVLGDSIVRLSNLWIYAL